MHRLSVDYQIDFFNKYVYRIKRDILKNRNKFVKPVFALIKSMKFLREEIGFH
jgi:hypothetical protein